MRKGLVINIKTFARRIRYKVVQMMKQQKHESVSDIKCSDLIDPRVKDRIAIRVLLDFAYGRKSPELRVVHCTLQDRKCRVIYKVQVRLIWRLRSEIG